MSRNYNHKGWKRSSVHPMDNESIPYIVYSLRKFQRSCNMSMESRKSGQWTDSIHCLFIQEVAKVMQHMDGKREAKVLHVRMWHKNISKKPIFFTRTYRKVTIYYIIWVQALRGKTPAVWWQLNPKSMQSSGELHPAGAKTPATYGMPGILPQQNWHGMSIRVAILMSIWRTRSGSFSFIIF